MSFGHRSAAALLALAVALAAPVALAQDSGSSTRKVISIGNPPRVDGLRINFRDRDLESVRGVNLTIWNPYAGGSGTVRGFALGAPITGAGEIRGVGAGLFGVSATENIAGLTLGGIGAGAGGSIRGITIGGVGVGAGGSIRGLAIGRSEEHTSKLQSPC